MTQVPVTADAVVAVHILFACPGLLAPGLGVTAGVVDELPWIGTRRLSIQLRLQILFQVTQLQGGT